MLWKPRSLVVPREMLQLSRINTKPEPPHPRYRRTAVVNVLTGIRSRGLGSDYTIPNSDTPMIDGHFKVPRLLDEVGSSTPSPLRAVRPVSNIHVPSHGVLITSQDANLDSAGMGGSALGICTSVVSSLWVDLRTKSQRYFGLTVRSWFSHGST